MSDLWLSAMMLAIVGGIAGFSAGLFGIGGGAVMVPALFFAFHLLGVDEAVLMHSAVATSAAVIIVNSWRSVRSHHAKDSVDFDLLWPRQWWTSYALWIGVGSFTAATWLAPRLSSQKLTLIFAIVAIGVALQFIFGRPNKVLRSKVPGGAGPPVIGGGIGGLSAVMGIGGGSLSVPFLTLCGVPIHKAIGTAAGFGLAIAIPASIGFVLSGWALPGRPLGSLGYVNGLGFALIVICAWPMVPLGARLAHRLKPEPLRRAFGVLLLVVALNMARLAVS
jgi:uncharacterized membrane protein YfcA